MTAPSIPDLPAADDSRLLRLVRALAGLLPGRLRGLATPAREALAAQFLQFGMVGAVGFVFDAATVYALAPALGLYGAGAAAYVVAASVNWLLNRVWTFAAASRHGPVHRQWLMFLATNLVGFTLNRGAYFALIAGSATARADPVLAVAAGALAGMFANFVAARRLVFR